MYRRYLYSYFLALVLSLTATAQASLNRSQHSGTQTHAIHRRLGIPFFDILSPQGQAQRMLHCLGQGPLQHADTQKVTQWMQANPPTDPHTTPNALFSLNPSDWGFHGFKKRNSQSMNSWKRDGKTPELRKRLQTYRKKLLMCNDQLKSDVNAANSTNPNSGVASQNGQLGESGAANGAQTAAGSSKGADASKPSTQQGSSDPDAQSSVPSADNKPAAPGLGPQQAGVTPVLDPNQHLLPRPDGTKEVPSATPAKIAPSSNDESSGKTATTSSCDQMIERPEYGTLSVEQKTAFIAAVMCVRNKPSRYDEDGMNAFDDWVLLHIQMLKYVHFTAYFLVFHRAMLAVVEKDLRDCGMPFGLPWVDWTKHAADGSQAPIFDSDPTYGFGTNGQGTADKCPYGSGKQILDGAFANITFNAPFKHSLCREFNNMDVQHPDPHWGSNCTTFLTDRFNAGLQTAHNEGKFFDFASALEISSHQAVHTCLGGNMPWLSSSANDLTFYVHHGFIDRQFSVWQSQSDSNKNAFQGPKKQTRNGAHPPWDATANDVMNLRPLRANVKVSDVLDHQSGKMDGLMCYRYTS